MCNNICQPRPLSPIGNLNELPTSCFTSKKLVSVDLVKLHSGFTPTPHLNAHIQQPLTKENSSLSAVKHLDRVAASGVAKPRTIRTVQEFFGPVVSVDSSDDDSVENDDLISPIARFRIRGFSEPVRLVCPSEQMNHEREAVARDVRAIETTCRLRQLTETKPVEKKPYLGEQLCCRCGRRHR